MEASSTSEVANLRAQNEESVRALAELKAEMEGLEKERDFYFEKLRDVEVLLQELEDRGEGNELTASIMKILYATAEGFEQVDTEEEVTATVVVEAHNDQVDGDAAPQEVEEGDEDTY